VFCDGFLIGF